MVRVNVPDRVILRVPVGLTVGTDAVVVGVRVAEIEPVTDLLPVPVLEPVEVPVPV